MVPLKFAAVFCLVYFTIFVNPAEKRNCTAVLEKLDKMEGLCQGDESDNCVGTDVCTEIKSLLEEQLENLYSLVETISMSLQPVSATSCKELYDKGSRESQVFPLMFGSQKIPVYCHMGNFGCGDGGWTLAMKIDGNKDTFHQDSHFWGDINGYNLEGGKTGFDLQETKLPTYWNTSFSKICLGMKIGQQINFIVINKEANSLYSLIADGQYRATSLGRNTWKTLVGTQASLQYNCNKEGFNAVCNSYRRARIGILSNNEHVCTTCDSRIGFGIGPLNRNTCGNVAMHGGDNGDKNIKNLVGCRAVKNSFNCSIE